VLHGLLKLLRRHARYSERLIAPPPWQIGGAAAGPWRA